MEAESSHRISCSLFTVHGSLCTVHVHISHSHKIITFILFSGFTSHFEEVSAFRDGSSAGYVQHMHVVSPTLGTMGCVRLAVRAAIATCAMEERKELIVYYA